MKRGAVYQCCTCSYMGDRRQAIRHVIMKHKTASQVPYSCNICDKRALKHTEMRKHFEGKHPEEDVKSNTTGTGHMPSEEDCGARVLTREESLKFYDVGQCAKEDGHDRTSTPSQQPPTLATDHMEMMEVLQRYPNIMSQVQGLVEAQRAVQSILPTPLDTSTPSPKTTPFRTIQSPTIPQTANQIFPTTFPEPTVIETPPRKVTIKTRKSTPLISRSPEVIVIDPEPTPPKSVITITPIGMLTQSPSITKTYSPDISGSQKTSPPNNVVVLHPTEGEITDLFKLKDTPISPLKPSPVKTKRSHSKKRSKSRESPAVSDRKKFKKQDNETVPLSSVAEIVEASIKNSVDAVASAIIAAAKHQPMPPEQDLRPISNQLMTTNANLSQISGIMSANNTRHGDLAVGIQDLVKATNGVSAQLSRMARALTVFTEVANKLDGHIIEQTSAIRTVCQGAIDSNTSLTEAMKAQTGAFRTIQSRFTTLMKPESPSGEVSHIVRKILKLEPIPSKPPTTKHNKSETNRSSASRQRDRPERRSPVRRSVTPFFRGSRYDRRNYQVPRPRPRTQKPERES